MKCPHCLVHFHDDPMRIYLDTDPDGAWGVISRTCPSCGKLVIELATGKWDKASGPFHCSLRTYLGR